MHEAGVDWQLMARGKASDRLLCLTLVSQFVAAHSSAAPFNATQTQQTAAGLAMFACVLLALAYLFLRWHRQRDASSRQADTASTTPALQRLAGVIDATPDSLKVIDVEGHLLHLNPAGLALLEAESLAQASQRRWSDYVVPEHRELHRQWLTRGWAGEAASIEFELLTLQGRRLWVASFATLLPGMNGRELLITTRNIQPQKKTEQLESGERRVLEMIAANASVANTLDVLLQVIEAHSPELFCSLLLLEEGQRLRHGAAPRLPAEYIRQVDGLSIGPDTGSCGTAAYLRQPVHVADVQTDPRWQQYRYLVAPYGFRACWSTPVLAMDGSVLATFAIYRHEPGLPDAQAMRLIDIATHVASICLARDAIQRSLHESETRFRGIFEQAADGIMIISTQGRFVDANPAALSLVGYSLAELRRMGPMELIVPDDLHRVREPHLDSASTFPQVAELRHLRRDGSCFPVEISRRRLDSQHFIAVLRDLSERRRNESRIHQLNRVYAMLNAINQMMVRRHRQQDIFADACRIAVEQGAFHSAWIGMADVDANRMRVVAAHGEARDFLLSLEIHIENSQQGPDPACKAWRTQRHVVVNDLGGEAALQSRRDEALALGMRSAAALPLTLGNKSLGVLVLNSVALDFFDTEEMRLLDQMAADISFALELDQHEAERARNEEALRESEERFRQVMDNIDEIIWIRDFEQDRLIYISPAFERMTGYRAADFLVNSMDLLQTVHPEDRAMLQAGVVDPHTFHQQQSAREFRLLMPSGEIRWVRGRSFMIRRADGEIYRMAGVVEDITERRHLEEQVRQAQKMEAVGQLAGGIAHDFNNILSVIMGNAELARQDIAVQHPTQHNLNEVLKASIRARNLVQQILAFSRRQQTQREIISLKPIVEETERFLRATLPAGVQLQVRCDEAPSVLADATQVQQAIINLCTNAWQSLAGKPGSIDVHLQQSWLTAAQGSIAAGHYAMITVRDTGRGMEQAVMDHIFEPFFTTRPAGGGTGLGLAVVHGIMQAHQGSVTVGSTPDQGSCFALYFPAANAPLQPALPSATAAAAAGHGEHILFVDDEAALVDINTRLFERLGYRVTSFTRPMAALEAFRAQPQHFDVLLTDLNMPGMSGLELAAAIRAIRADLPVLLASGYVSDELRAQARTGGIDHVFYKPNSAADLCKAVQRAINEIRGR